MLLVFEFPGGPLRAQRAECGIERGTEELESHDSGKLFPQLQLIVLLLLK